jgi:hypothetical protein
LSSSLLWIPQLLNGNEITTITLKQKKMKIYTSLLSRDECPDLEAYI